MRVITLLTAAFFSIGVAAQDDSVYEGRKAAEWVQDVGHEDDPIIKEHVRDAVVELGAESIKPLAEALRKESSFKRREYLEELLAELDATPETRAKMIELLKDDHFAVRVAAIHVLTNERYWEDAEVAVAIEALTKDKDKAVAKEARMRPLQIKELLAQRKKDQGVLELPGAEVKPVPPPALKENTKNEQF